MARSELHGFRTFRLSGDLGEFSRSTALYYASILAFPLTSYFIGYASDLAILLPYYFIGYASVLAFLLTFPFTIYAV